MEQVLSVPYGDTKMAWLFCPNFRSHGKAKLSADVRATGSGVSDGFWHCAINS